MSSNRKREGCCRFCTEETPSPFEFGFAAFLMFCGTFGMNPTTGSMETKQVGFRFSVLTFSLEMLSLLPMIPASFRRLSALDCMAAKQSRAYRTHSVLQYWSVCEVFPSHPLRYSVYTHLNTSHISILFENHLSGKNLAFLTKSIDSFPYR